MILLAGTGLLPVQFSGVQVPGEMLISLACYVVNAVAEVDENAVGNHCLAPLIDLLVEVMELAQAFEELQ